MVIVPKLSRKQLHTYYLDDNKSEKGKNIIYAKTNQFIVIRTKNAKKN